MTRNGKYQVYALLDPYTQAVRYVGYTTTTLQTRFSYHCMCADENPRTEWIQGLLKVGKAPIIFTLEKVNSKVHLPEVEKKWISYGKSAGWDLLNVSEGGERVSRYNNGSRRGKRKVVV